MENKSLYTIFDHPKLSEQLRLTNENLDHL